MIPDAAIWKVDRFATHDGPGIRTSFYFKGCPLRCLWCSNPEGQCHGDELAFVEDRCTGCGRCYGTCASGALAEVDGRATLEHSKCTNCGECIPICPTGALYAYKKSYGLPQVVDLVTRDRHIYRRSGGGITCTGGEPFAQPEFLTTMLQTSHRQGIHTAVESCGYADPAQFEPALADIDWLFLDIKHLDAGEHRRITGRENDIVLANVRRASSICAAQGKVLAIRQVLAPGFNDGENVHALARLASGLARVDFIELLPYHEYGRHKYRALGRRYPLDDLESPSNERMLEYQEIVLGYGIECRIGMQ